MDICIDRRMFLLNLPFRVSIQTKPLDIIYSPAAASRVTEFFSNTAKFGGHVRMAELKLAGRD